MAFIPRPVGMKNPRTYLQPTPGAAAPAAKSPVTSLYTRGSGQISTPKRAVRPLPVKTPIAPTLGIAAFRGKAKY